MNKEFRENVESAADYGKDIELLNPKLVEKKRKLISNTIFGFVLLVLIGISVINVMKGTEVITFKGFLNILANVPTIDMTWQLPHITMPNILGVNIIIWLINLNLDGFNAILFLLRGIVNVLIFLVYFIGIIFS